MSGTRHSATLTLYFDLASSDKHMRVLPDRLVDEWAALSAPISEVRDIANAPGNAYFRFEAQKSYMGCVKARRERHLNACAFFGLRVKSDEDDMVSVQVIGLCVASFVGRFLYELLQGVEKTRDFSSDPERFSYQLFLMNRAAKQHMRSSGLLIRCTS